MIDILDFKGEDFKAVCDFEGWKIGLLRYSERFSNKACLGNAVRSNLKRRKAI